MTTRQQLIADAEQADLTVKAEEHRTTILRTKRDGVIVWADGTITRYNQVNSTTMSAKQARTVLALHA